LAYRGRKIERLHRHGHVAKPGVALRLTDRERQVAHSQPRMSALLAVSRWTAPVLDEEQRQPFGRARQVLLWIDPTQHRIICNARIEALDQEPECPLTAGQLEHAAIEHPVTHAPRSSLSTVPI